MSSNKHCKKVSETRCSPHEGPMSPDCELSSKNRCVAKKKTAKKTEVEVETTKPKSKPSTKSCKKVSDTRCAAHDGPMSPECELSDKNRCIRKKTEKKKTSKMNNTKKKKEEKQVKKEVAAPLPKKKTSTTKNVGKNMIKYEKWLLDLDKLINYKVKQRVLEYKDTSKDIKLDTSSYVKVSYQDVPEESLGISSYIPYKDDSDYSAKNDFVKLNTCQKICENQGVFELNELKSFILDYKYTSCPFCKENFKLSSKMSTPPYGSMIVIKYMNWFVIDFKMSNGKTDDGTYHGEKRKAFLPISDEGKLGLWLMEQAWMSGKLFRIGESLTTGKKNVIVYGNIHIKSETTGAHGFQGEPKKDMKKRVLPNLISECNGANIYTPMQLDEFDMVKVN